MELASFWFHDLSSCPKLRTICAILTAMSCLQAPNLVTTGGMEGKLISYGTCKRSRGSIYMFYKPLKMIWMLRFGLDSAEEMFGEKIGDA